MFEVLQNFGDPLVHYFINKNLVGPMLNTTRFNFCKEGFVYSINNNEFTFHYMCLILKNRRKFLGLSMPIPFEYREDETKLPHRIGGWIRLLGFVDSKFHLNIQFINANLISIHHQLNIKNVFEILQVGTMCRVLLVNPLV
jgi:hypothetical protein